jgi:hypothetical protein
MDLNDSPQQAQYREKVRAWLEEHKAEAPALTGNDEDEVIRGRRTWQG